VSYEQLPGLADHISHTERNTSIMRKFFTMLLCAVLTVSLMIPAAAADVKAYADAADGELLYTADFSDPAYGVLVEGNVMNYEVSDGGSTVTLTAKEAVDEYNYWGIKLDKLGAAGTEKYTLTYKVRANGEIGKNNSIGVGALWGGAETVHRGEDLYYILYGNHNTMDEAGAVDMRRNAIGYGPLKIADYIMTPEIDTDEDDFVTMKMEIDADAKTIRSYAMIEGDWEKLDEQVYSISTADACACIAIYSYYGVVDSTVKDVKLFKGNGLTDEQLNPAPVVETEAEVVDTPSEEAAAPQTFDAGIIAAAAAVISLAGYTLSKKSR